MPGLVRKLLICAGAQGLLLQPVNNRNEPLNAPTVCIDYKTNAISPYSQDENSEQLDVEQIEAHGIVGLLNLVSSSYLISISRREQVATIRGKPIYAITDVTLIPLSSQSDASIAISQANKASKTGKESAVGETQSDDEEDDKSSVVSEDEGHGDSPSTPTAPVDANNAHAVGALQKGTSIIADVIKDKGKYGRFAEKWFSKGGWNATVGRNQGMKSEDDLTREQKRQGLEALPDDSKAQDVTAVTEEVKPTQTPPEHTVGEEKDEQKTSVSSSESVLQSLTPRILRSTKLYFASRNFYFSYDYDLSRSLPRQEPASSTIPLSKRFDDLYFWNRHLISPFMKSGHSGFVLPLLQGFVGQRAFTIGSSAKNDKDKVVDAVEKADEVVKSQGDESAASASKVTPTQPSMGTPSQPLTGAGPQLDQEDTEDFLLTLISRRSVHRAGLRYLRRGIDEDGNVANSVETEQLLTRSAWDAGHKTFSFTQYRGSMPLFFSQSPYSFKPLPIQYGSEETNQKAFNRHFTNLFERYGDVQAVSLVDKHATEVKIGESYEHHAKLSNNARLTDQGVASKTIGFEWFDFHAECRGMKFENVSVLLNTLDDTLQSFGWSEQQNDKVVRSQAGVLRTNCMDCLDRTNVTQTLFASNSFKRQLATLGLDIDLQTDPRTSWFNTLWADNGDAISRQYAGTAALKGDFTRTRKRNWTGALSDFTLTMNRYYNNIFGDYFLQTCIDYWLGNAGPGVFEDFETDMMTQDYALDMKRVRQTAIETCMKVVLEDPGEDVVAGWTLSCPAHPNTTRSLPFEECVVLLTASALYACRFDWNTEKVGSFERVELVDIDRVSHGVYITSTLGPAHLDESKNVGFVIQYRPQGEALIRTNTRSLANEKAADKAEDDKKATADKPADSRILAFKALPPRSSAAKEKGSYEDGMSEKQLVKHLCEEIQRVTRLAFARQTVGRMDQAAEADKDRWEIEEKDIISATEAKRSTGYLETLGYSLKKLVWS